MTSGDAGHRQVYRWLLRLYPVAFRARFEDEMVQLFSDHLGDARASGTPAGIARTWVRTLGDLAVTAASEHARRDRTAAHSLASPSTSSRVLGLAGILGGAVLLAAFLVDIGPDFNNLRIILFNVGAMAVVIAVHRRQVVVAPALALLAAGPVILANAWHFVMVVLATGRLQRLGLVSGPYGQIIQPLALIGIALNGIGWIILGLDVATRRRASNAPSRLLRRP